MQPADQEAPKGIILIPEQDQDQDQTMVDHFEM
jgi:hypothetical protein